MSPLLSSVFECALIGIAGLGLWCLWNGVRSRKWPTVPGIVLHSDIEGQSDSEGSGSYRVRILYRYEVSGRQYLGKRVYFGQAILWTGSFDRLLSKTGRYNPGTPVQVHFHKKWPSLSVLQPGMTLEAWVVTLLAFGLLWWVLSAVSQTRLSDLGWSG